MGTLAHRLRPDIRKPVWHQALRLPRGEVISHDKYREIAHDYMRRMGWDSNKHQYVVIVSDDPEGQHIHIVGNRVGIDGSSIYLGKNENLISTRVCQELERDYGLTVTKGPKYVLDERGIPRAVYSGPKDKKPKKGEVRMLERQQREGEAKSLPRSVLQRVLKSALAAGQSGGMAAFLETTEAGGVRVLANVARTGKVNGLSFESGGVSFKASAISDAYAWAALTTAVRYEEARDQALLEARSLRHVTRDQLPLGQPASTTRELLAPPVAAEPIVVPASAPREAQHAQRYQPTYRQARCAAPAPRSRLSLAGRPPIDSLRSLPGGTVDATDGAWRAQHTPESVVSRDAQLLLGGNRSANRRLRPSTRATDPAAGGLKRDATLLEAARFAQELRHDAPVIEGNGRITVPIELLSSALDGYVAKQGRWDTLYIRKSDDTYAMVDTGSCIKLASSDDSTVRAALAAAAGKWTELWLSGSEAFMARAVREAVRLGISNRIANPELQGLITKARCRLATEGRVAEAGIADGRGREARTLKASIDSNPSLKRPSPGRRPK
jgi:hypothetical protein